MPSLRLKYLVEDFDELIRRGHEELPPIKLHLLIPEYRELAKYPDRPQPAVQTRHTGVRNPSHSC